MKKNVTRFAAVLLILSVILSTFVVSTSAASTSSYGSNWGERGEVCVELSSQALSYYTGQNTYDNFLDSTDVFGDLCSLMKGTHSNITSYNDCRDLVWIVDCENNNTGNATTLYTDYSMSSSDWSAGGWDCNREHLWPQSKGGGTSQGGSDLHHIRPSEGNVNSSRGNKAYANGGSSSISGKLSGDIGGYYTSDTFEPLDYAKGDVARICLYVYVRWYGIWGASTKAEISEVFPSIDTLLEWCELDPVDTWEMGRNDVVQNIQGNRNVFIDYPELAWVLFDRADEIPNDMTTPSGEAKSGNTGSGDLDGSGGIQDGATPDIPTVCIHTDTELRGVKSATCTEVGYTGDKYCKSCGTLISAGTSIDKKAHTPGNWVTEKEPTSTESGLKTKSCTVCGTQTDQETILPISASAAFKTLVSSVKTAKTLEERYEAISTALDVYADLNDSERDDVSASYTELCAYIESYNSTADEVNAEQYTVAEIAVFVLSGTAALAALLYVFGKRVI